MKKGRRRELGKGEVIETTEGESLNLIAKGFVKRYLISDEGTLGVQVIYGPGNFFPLTLTYKALFDQDIYQGRELFYYEAVTDTVIYVLDTDLLKECVDEDPLLYRDLLFESGRRLHFMIHNLENLALRSSYKRITHHLAYMGRHFGTEKDGKVQIKFPLTQQDLADMLSLTRETVSRNMVQLKKKQLITTGKATIINDLQKLEQEAEN